METEDRNRPYSYHRDCRSLNNPCLHLLSALIMSPPLLGMERVKWPLPPLWEPNCLSTPKCPRQSLLGAAGRPRPHHRLSAAALSSLLGLHE